MSTKSIIQAILMVAGVATISSIILRVCSFLTLHLRKRGNVQRYAHVSSNGESPWAVVTGASDGIGRSFAHSLAEHGFNVVIHGRNPVKLESVLESLQKSFPQRSFRMLIADAGAVKCKTCMTSQDNAQSHSTGVDFDVIRQELQDLNITLLVNNVGGGPRNPTLAPLHEHPAINLAQYVSLDALFPLHLTHTLLPTLIRNSPSLVINIGSLADNGSPFLSFYGACKAFDMSMSKALSLERAEVGNGDVEFLAVRTGNVTGVAWRDKAPSIFCPTSKVMVDSVLAKIGSGRKIVVGYWGHALQVAAMDILPERLVDKMMVGLIRDLMRAFNENVESKKKET